MRHAWLFLIPLLVACGSQRRQLDAARVYEEGGMHWEAYSAYRELYTRKPTMATAHVGMQRAAKALVMGKAAAAIAAYDNGDIKGGDGMRDETATFRRRFATDGVSLQEEPGLEAARSQALAREARNAMEQAETAYRASKFEEAAIAATRALELDPTLKEAEYLQRVAQLETRYQQALRAEELGLLHDAYRAYSWITEKDIGYKDAWQRLASIRERVHFTLAIVPLYNNGIYTVMLGGTPGLVEQQLIANIESAILALNDASIILVDRDRTDVLLAEQQRSMEATYDERYVVNAGRLMGAARVLAPRIIRFDDILNRHIEVQIQIIDTGTGRIELSQVLGVTKDELRTGNTRTQLIELVAGKIARSIAAFKPAPVPTEE